MHEALDIAAHDVGWMTFNAVLYSVALVLLVAVTPPHGRAGRFVALGAGAAAVLVAGVAVAFGRGPTVLLLAGTMLAVGALGNIARVRDFRPFRWSVTAVAILFLPNAAYVVSHLVHWVIALRNTDSHWATVLVSGLQFGLYVAGGLLVLQASTAILLRRLPAVPSIRWAAWVLIAVASSFAVYLGRVERFNSWDVLIHPATWTEIAQELAPRWQLWAATGAGSLILMALMYLMPAVAGRLRLPMGSVDDRLPLSTREIAAAGLRLLGAMWLITAGSLVIWSWLPGVLLAEVSGCCDVLPRVALGAVGVVALTAGVACTGSQSRIAPRVGLAGLLGAVLVIGGSATYWMNHESGWPRTRLGDGPPRAEMPASHVDPTAAFECMRSGSALAGWSWNTALATGPDRSRQTDLRSTSGPKRSDTFMTGNSPPVIVIVVTVNEPAARELEERLEVGGEYTIWRRGNALLRYAGLSTSRDEGAAARAAARACVVSAERPADGPASELSACSLPRRQRTAGISDLAAANTSCENARLVADSLRSGHHRSGASPAQDWTYLPVHRCCSEFVDYATDGSAEIVFDRGI